MGLHYTPKYSDIGKFFFSKPVTNLGYISLGFFRKSERELVKNGLIDRDEETMKNSINMVSKIPLP